MQNITWIFFDCFNTLIDDFDETGDQSGMKPLGELAASAGVFNHPDDFHKTYLQWRKSEWNGSSWHEVELADRIRGTLALGETPIRPFDQLVGDLVDCFHETYPLTVRITPGAKDMLNRVGHKFKTCLVSNFFLPGYPETLLRKFDLHHTFDILIDSAQVGYKKPGNRFYEYAADQAGLAKTEFNRVLFIGDSLINDVLTPKNLGMQAMRFDRSGEVANFKPTPDGVPSVSSWDEFLVD